MNCPLCNSKLISNLSKRDYPFHCPKICENYEATIYLDDDKSSIYSLYINVFINDFKYEIWYESPDLKEICIYKFPISPLWNFGFKNKKDLMISFIYNDILKTDSFNEQMSYIIDRIGKLLLLK